MDKSDASVTEKIGIFGNFGIENFGNEATLEAMLAYLKQARPDAEISCICTKPEKVQEDHQIRAEPISWRGPPLLRKFANWIHAIRKVRKFDVLFIPGTGILTDWCVPPLGMPYALFRWCLAARLFGTRIAFVSVGAGPIEHRLSRWFIKHAVSMGQYRSYRNIYSKEFMQNIGVNTRDDFVFPDVVFGLNLSRPLRLPTDRRLTVGIGVMAFSRWNGPIRINSRPYEEYLRRLTKFVIWLLDHEYPVRILMGATIDQDAVDDLQQAITAQKPSLSTAQLIAELARSHHDVIPQTADQDIIIATRFHNLVFALNLGKLVISAGYGPKQTELMAGVGLADFCQDCECLDVERLIDQFMELTSNKSCYESRILSAAISYRLQLSRQYGLLAPLFDPACSLPKGPIARGVAPLAWRRHTYGHQPPPAPKVSADERKSNRSFSSMR